MANEVMNGSTGGAVGHTMADLAKQLSAGIAESRSQTVIPGGKPFLRLLKDGSWVYGGEDIEVEEGSRWCVNVLSLAHGWCCWVDVGGKNELKGETMVPMSRPRPAQPAPIMGKDFSEQRSFELKCMDGEDAGTEVQYKVASIGGMRAVDGLLAEIQTQLLQNPEFAFPVLELAADHYNHKKYGKTYTPILNRVGWANMEGVMQSDAPALEATPEAPTTPRRRPAPEAAAAASSPEPKEEPTSTTQARATQRRRPGR